MLDRAIGVVGVALALIFGLWSLAPEGWPKMPSWAILGGVALGILLIGLAAGLIIADRRNIPVAIAPPKPDLHLIVSGANVFIPDAMPNITGIGVNARVWNTGAPSIATGWSMKVIPNGSHPITAQLTALPNVLSATGQFNSAQLLADNSLEEKTKDKPINVTPVSGVILFYVALPKNIVQAPDTVWKVTVMDIYERETTATNMVGDWLSR